MVHVEIHFHVDFTWKYTEILLERPMTDHNLEGQFDPSLPLVCRMLVRVQIELSQISVYLCGRTCDPGGGLIIKRANLYTAVPVSKETKG